MSEVVNPYPIDPAELYASLAEQDVNAIVGLSCNDSACPLARHLNILYPGSVFLVGMVEYRRVMDDISLGREPDAVFPLPEWAQDFVQLIDESGEYCDDIPVKALDALSFLCAVCDVLLVEGVQA